MKYLLKILLVVICMCSMSLSQAETSNLHGQAKVQASQKKHSKQVKKSKHHKKKQHKKPNYMLGIASYYGENDGFAGKQMADGDVFNPRDIYSAAHPTLPLGTKLEVTNLRNGRSIYVEVRDRMPHNSRGRVIDLSVAAAKYLGMYNRGLTKVKLSKVTEDEYDENKGYMYVSGNDDGTPD